MKTAIDNSAVVAYMSEVYATTQKADTFVIGFNVEGNVLMAEMPLATILDNFIGVSMTSDEIPCKRLRLKPLTKKLMPIFSGFNPVPLCDMSELQEIAKARFSGNCGQAFEYLACKYYNGTPSAPNTPFWQGGDFTANGISYQAKFQNATVITEQTAAKAEQECC